MIVIAHNIRSLHNVGSILRNAAAFGVKKVYLTGITGVPPRKEIAKVSLGAEDLVPWEAGEIDAVIDGLKREGYAVWGLENGRGSIEISAFMTSDRQHPIALVLGNEVEGIDDDTRAMLEGLVMIPMEKKQSLNVSVASGVAMYALRNDIRE
jgi:tRNA G18 (ribose-2'-O)-methylase SpoU